MNSTETGLTALACGVLGWLLKTWPRFPNWAIPHVVTVTGTTISFFTTDHSFGAAVVGAVAGAASTGFHQIVNQTRTLDPK